MNTLNRRLILIATTTLALTATAAFVIQTDAYNVLKMDFNLLLKENKVYKRNIQDQAAIIDQLEEEIQIKTDSIGSLLVTIDGLVAEINVLKEKVSSKNQKVEQLSSKVNKLTKEINQLKSGNSEDQKMIAALADERNELLKKMVALDKERQKQKDEIKMLEEAVAGTNDDIEELEISVEANKELVQSNNANLSASNEPYPAAPPAPNSIDEEMEKLIKTKKQARMTEIVSDTKVNFTNIALKNQKEGRDINKINNDGWRYTIIDFDLEHPNPDVILDEAFILQVFDVDNHKVVPVNESNPGFPDSKIGSTGYRFIYEGQPLSVSYFNSQKKTGKNYEIRLYYAGKGFLIPLPNGSTRILNDGAVAAR